MIIETPEQLKKAMTKLGISKNCDLAEICGVTPEMVSMWMSGKRKIQKSHQIIMNMKIERIKSSRGQA